MCNIRRSKGSIMKNHKVKEEINQAENQTTKSTRKDTQEAQDVQEKKCHMKQCCIIQAVNFMNNVNPFSLPFLNGACARTANSLISNMRLFTLEVIIVSKAQEVEIIIYPWD